MDSVRDTQEIHRERKKRVDRMRSMIIALVVFGMVFAILSIVALTVSVVSLGRRIHTLEDTIEQISDGITANTSDAVDAPGGRAVDADPAGNINYDLTNAEDAADIDFSQIIVGMDDPANAAGEGDTHYVYLTFDSVPGEQTFALLDALEASGVKATFFVSGECGTTADEAVAQIYDSGHTLGMHSYCNQYSTLYASVEAFENDLARITDHVTELTGTSPRYYRFPGGSGNEISNLAMAEFVRTLNDNDIIYFDWNVTSGDLGADVQTDAIVDRVTSQVAQYRTSVVLLHDSSDATKTAEAIGPLVEALRAMDAVILPIDEHTTRIQYIKAESVK